MTMLSWQPQLSYLDANATDLLYFTLMIWTRLFAVQDKPKILLEMSPT
jgi:hypothetical protein